MVGSELAAYSDYLLKRADSELSVRSRLSDITRRLAPYYVRVFGIPEIGVQMRIRRIARLIPKKDMSVVDIGCGAGIMLAQLRRRCTATRLAGIEPDARSAQIARESHPYAEIYCDDVQAVAAQRSGAFDYAVCLDVLEHIPDDAVDSFIRACAQLLKPGGTLIIHVPHQAQFHPIRAMNRWSHPDHQREGFSVPALRSALERAGLQVELIQPRMFFIPSLAWDLNMLCAATPLQAVVFPLLMLAATVGELIPTARHNALFGVARAPG
jgi:SAM-dependent methyltransferase